MGIISLVKGNYMLIKPSSALRNNYDEIVKAAQEEGVVFITRQGEGEMVFMTIEEYERREAEAKLASILMGLLMLSISVQLMNVIHKSSLKRGNFYEQE